MAKVDEAKLIEQFNKAKQALDGFRKQERARQRREKAHADARRKAIVGEMVLEYVQTNPHEHDRLMARLDAYVKDDRDRALFDLPSKDTASTSAAQNGQPDLAESPNDTARN